VVENIKSIVRQEMNAIGGAELLMTTLQRKELWARTDRWDDATKAQWRKDGSLDVVNARTQQVMKMSTAILDDYDANNERLDILAATSRLDVPLLVLHGGRDESVPVAESQLIADRSRDASRVVIANASHTYNAIHPLVNVPAELTMAAAITARFISVYS